MLEIENDASNFGFTVMSCSCLADSEPKKLGFKFDEKPLGNSRLTLSLLLFNSRLIASIDGKFALMHIPSKSKRSRTSQEKISGCSSTNASILLVISGVMSRFLEEGMAPGSMEPVS